MRPLPRPELLETFVCTSSKLLVELKRLANSVKLNRLVLVLLSLFSLPSVTFRLLDELVLTLRSLEIGIVADETDRCGI